MKKIIFIFVPILLLLSCTGKESLGVDTDAPNKPELVSHLGDTGDIQSYQGNTDTLNFYNTNDLDFENNGIDAIMDGNWIKTQWHRLQDSDIDFLKIYRFSWQDYLNDTLDFVQIIDTVDYDNEIKYVDKTPMIDKDYFYFIEAFDEAGNSTTSDTTGYKLIYKPILTSPSIDESFQSIYQVTFEWQADSNVNQYRLLVFNEERELIWRKTPLDTGYFSEQYDGPPVESGTTLIWRVDAFGLSSEIYIEDNYYIVNTGAESIERYLSIN